MPDRRLTIPLDDLIPAPWNPKQPISGRYREGLSTSLDHFGLRDDLKVWPDDANPGKYYVLDGNQRLGVLRDSGMESVECRVLDDLDEADAKLFTASFDRNAARFDEGKLSSLADELKAKGADLVAKLLRADVAMVRPPEMEPPALAAAKEELTTPSIPLMFNLSREGYELARGYLLKSKNKLKREERLLSLLAILGDRQIDDLIVDLAVHLGGKLVK